MGKAQIMRNDKFIYFGLKVVIHKMMSLTVPTSCNDFISTNLMLAYFMKFY